MLENARRQALLVFVALVAGLLCTLFMSPGWGMDLKGGNQLIYEVPEEVMTKLVAAEKTTVDKVMDQTVHIVRDRIDPTGTLDALVSRSGHLGILIELPYREANELNRIKQRISSLGKLELRVVAAEPFSEDNVTFDMKKEKERLENWLKTGGKELVLDKFHNIDRFNEDPANGPIAFNSIKWFPYLVEPQLDNRKAWTMPMSFQGSTEGVASLTDSVVDVFDTKADWNGGLVSEAMQKVERPFLLEYVAINMKERHFTGENLDPSGVSPGVSPEGRLAVNYKVRDELAGAYSDWSFKYLKKHSAIILNGVVRSAPYFVSRIPGYGQISGGFSQAEVDELVKVLRTGSLQVEPQIVSDLSVGPTLGEIALHRGGVSLIAGTVAVFVFMLWYYKIAGLVACVTLLLNVFLLWASVLFMQATITLPGLGGIVLTMGMAVDANVLIYERIREETERGKDILRAVRAGFERAMSAILDSNITTFLTGLVLYNVGVGPVRGFAVTLMVGIVTTVFTQFFVTRLLFHYLMEHKKLNDFKVRRFFAQPNIDYFKYAKPFIAGSLVVTLGGLLYAFFVVPSEVAYGIDFKGGANLQMVLQQPAEVATVRSRLAGDSEFASSFRNFQVNTIEAGPDGRATSFNVRLKLTDAMGQQIQDARTAWRAARKQAEADGKEPPPPFEAPYLLQMRRIFADDLQKPAFSEPTVVPGTNNDAYAQIELHFQRPVEVAKAQERLQKAKVPGVRVSVHGDAQATQGRDLFVEWTTLPTTRPSVLFDFIRESLEGEDPKDRLADAGGQPIKLSNPFPEANEIQGRMVGELRTAAIGALILSWALIIFYLRVRFHEYKYGLAAVISLIHDVLFAFGVCVLFNHLDIVHAEINLNMIACFLTIIGYSVNDSIIIFDRVRENLNEQTRLGGHLTLRQLINLSVNQTLSRTILTSGVTSFVVLAQFFVNWHTDTDLETFAFGMLVGIFTGTYSTVFIAAPILTWIADREARRKPQTPATATPAPVPAQ